MVHLRIKLFRTLGIEGPSRTADALLSSIVSVCGWVAGKFSALETAIKNIERCGTPDMNRELHSVIMMQWRSDALYRRLVASIHARALDRLNGREQREYRRMISAWNSNL